MPNHSSRVLSDLQHRLALERADLDVQVKKTREEFKKLGRRKLILQDEWKKLKIEQTNLKEDKQRFQQARLSPWFQSTLLPTRESKRVRVNVGGRTFESTVQVFAKDPDSLLAALVEDASPFAVDSDGTTPFLDRDWWLFRHILHFLRHGSLPQDRDLLSKLYHEAEFYNLKSLRVAICDFLDPAHIVEKSCSLTLGGLTAVEKQLLQTSVKKPKEAKQDDHEFWRRLTSKARTIDLDYGAYESKDWWTDAAYKGREYTARGPSHQQSHTRVPRRQSSDMSHHSVHEGYGGNLSNTWKAFDTAISNHGEF